MTPTKLVCPYSASIYRFVPYLEFSLDVSFGPNNSLRIFRSNLVNLFSSVLAEAPRAIGITKTLYSVIFVLHKRQFDLNADISPT